MKAGSCAILGRPNVGKSTLLNALLSKKVSIVSPKPQTTRDDIVGVYNEKGLQIVFIDTPGLFEGKEALDRMMAKAARRSLSGIDAIIYLIDASSTDFAPDDKTLASIKSDKPLFIVFSKIDLATAPMMEEASKHFAEAFPGYRQIQSSALENFGLKEIREAVASVLPEAEPLYPEGLLTDKDRRFAAKEAIREMLLHFLKQEVPHQCGVVISSFKEKKDACVIEAKIYCEKESQKGIIIGKDGAMIKRISMSARRRLEKMWQMNVTLVCEVECLPGWRNDPALLKKAGYGEDADD